MPKCKQSEGNCRNPAMKNGRYKIHGGKPSGPKSKHVESSKALEGTHSEMKTITQFFQGLAMTVVKLISANAGISFRLQGRPEILELPG